MRWIKQMRDEAVASAPIDFDSQATAGLPISHGSMCGVREYLEPDPSVADSSVAPAAGCRLATCGSWELGCPLGDNRRRCIGRPKEIERQVMRRLG